MGDRLIVSQNRLTIVNYNSIDYIKTETNINDAHYIYAQMNSGDKIWLGTYSDLDDIKEVVALITRWIDYSVSLSELNEYKSCTGSTFYMPLKTESHGENAVLKQEFINKILTGDKYLSLIAMKNAAKREGILDEGKK